MPDLCFYGKVLPRVWHILVHVYSLWPRVFVVCSTKTYPTTGWTGWASRPPCTEIRTAPGPCRRCTSTTGPSCTRTSTRTPPTPTPCLPVWAPLLTTLSREIKTLYTGRWKHSEPLRGEKNSLSGGQACIQAWRGQSGWAGGCKVSAVAGKKHRLSMPGDGRASRWRHWSPNCCRGAGEESDRQPLFFMFAQFGFFYFFFKWIIFLRVSAGEQVNKHKEREEFCSLLIEAISRTSRCFSISLSKLITLKNDNETKSTVISISNILLFFLKKENVTYVPSFIMSKIITTSLL